VEGFVDTPVGPVPKVSTTLSLRDHLGTVRARVGVARNQYKVNPGLYCVGDASASSPVFVTANYKLSFDALRKELTSIDAWILVTDTRGINVWCAAGKGTFSADEVALQVQRARLAEIVSHRELILPQFAATGVASHTLNKLCGFKGIFGPLRAEDIPRFLENGKEADELMRTVTFSLDERLILVPVEIALVWKPFAIVLFVIFLLSGISPEIFSIQAALARGSNAAMATVLAILAGALATPLLLPWIPGRQFWLKGVLAGAIVGLVYVYAGMDGKGIIEKSGLWLWIAAAASYMAMNFTGATPYTSLSGVEKEMRRGLPVQCAGVLGALALWIAAPFIS
jgi:hypothetical protein